MLLPEGFDCIGRGLSPIILADTVVEGLFVLLLGVKNN